jgi:hypothetical protein
MKDTQENKVTRVLGDINPEPERLPSSAKRSAGGDEDDVNEEANNSTGGGSNHDRTRHSGSRDVTEGTSGGTGTEVGGSRNFRTGTGATGTDIGNRPE